MKTITHIDAEKLAIGIQQVLLEMLKKGRADDPDYEASYPVKEFERLIMDEKQVDKKDAELVTERVINTGIVRWEIFGNNFVL